MLPQHGLYVCLAVCPSVTLVHPAKAIGRRDAIWQGHSSGTKHIILGIVPGPP